MTLSAAIKFRNLCAQLTPPETKLFINDVIDVDGNILFSALFHLMLTKCAYSNISADDLNNMLSNIILSRKKKQEAISTKHIHLHHLPASLIGYTASFLPQADYVKLSRCTRSLFIGCNSPNKMQQVNLLKWRSNNPVNLAQFPSATHLALNVYQFEKLIPAKYEEASFCKELTSMAIGCRNRGNFMEREMYLFTQQNYINLDHVTSLSFYNFGTPQNKFCQRRFAEFVSKLKLKYIEYLTLDHVNCIVDSSQMKQFCPLLKGLSMIGGFEVSRINLLHAFAEQLQYLHLRQYRKRNYNLTQVTFDKLEQLQLAKPAFETVHDLLQTANNVRYFMLHVTHKGKKLMDVREANKCMIKLMTSCRLLEYVAVYGTNLNKEWFATICEGIEYGLFTTKKWKRIRLVIKIIMKCNEPLIADEILFIVTRLITVMEKSEINDFVFIVSIESVSCLNADIDVSGALWLGLQHISSSIVVRRECLGNEKEEDCFCIANKDCKINGYSVKWMSRRL